MVNVTGSLLKFLREYEIHTPKFGGSIPKDLTPGPSASLRDVHGQMDDEVQEIIHIDDTSTSTNNDNNDNRVNEIVEINDDDTSNAGGTSIGNVTVLNHTKNKIKLEQLRDNNDADNDDDSYCRLEKISSTKKTRTRRMIENITNDNNNNSIISIPTTSTTAIDPDRMMSTNNKKNSSSSSSNRDDDNDTNRKRNRNNRIIILKERKKRASSRIITTALLLPIYLTMIVRMKY